jgi:hypothetical protein
MNRSTRRSFSWGIFCWGIMVCVICAATAQAQKTITFKGVRQNVTDFSDAGLDIGNAGFWFAQFNASAPVTGAAVDDNDRNSLPAWVIPDFDPLSATYSFGDLVFSEGGDTAWNTLTLPDGETGLSGSLVDPETADNSNNTISELVLGAGTPLSFALHIVVDNTNGEHDPAGRIRARAEGDPGFDEDDRVDPGVDAFNGIADVYTFRYDGWDVDDFLKLQLNSDVAGEAAGFAGIMFDVVPEPASGLLALLGGMGLGVAAMRRRR